MMTAAGMRAKIQAAINALGDPEGFASPQEYAAAAMEAFCQGIIEEMTENAEVSVPVVVGNVSGVPVVTAVGGFVGPGAGAGSGTVS